MDIYNVTLNSMRPCSRVEERQEVLTFAEASESGKDLVKRENEPI